jgi:hypothetical protein
MELVLRGPISYHEFNKLVLMFQSGRAKQKSFRQRHVECLDKKKYTDNYHLQYAIPV